jgi:DNA polymerase-4
MPMFQALRLCPEAVVVKPRFDAYAEASRRIRAMMEELTPAVEPLSLDEAFLDLTGTERLHCAPPALLLARLARRIEGDLGLSISIGLSHNKFLAKIASDLDKPRGFAIIGEAETLTFLADRSVRLIWGVGEVTWATLEKAGIRTFADLRRWERRDLASRFGSGGDRLWALARGQDARPVASRSAVRGLSNETTFGGDIGDPEMLDGHIWRLSEKLSARMKAKGLAGSVVTLKLKRADHTLLTRRLTLRGPTQLAGRIHRAARALLDAVPAGARYRLVGVGLSELCGAAQADATPDLLEEELARQDAAERAADRVRARFGAGAIVKGRSLR